MGAEVNYRHWSTARWKRLANAASSGRCSGCLQNRRTPCAAAAYPMPPTALTTSTDLQPGIPVATAIVPSPIPASLRHLRPRAPTPHEQVIVVVHEHEGVDLRPKASGQLGDQGRESASILVASADRFPAASAAHHVAPTVRNLNPQAPRRGASSPGLPAIVHCTGLTPLHCRVAEFWKPRRAVSVGRSIRP